MTRPSTCRAAARRGARGPAVALTVAAIVLAAGLAPATAAESKLTHHTGSRATFIHWLPLLDTENNPVKPDDDPVLPFSYRTSCTKCHDYAQVRKGWHSNATDPAVDPGRPGEPWILTDPRTGTQIPLSYRAWPNTWRPADIGMTPWTFSLMFGHHMPGGGPGEETAVKDPAARWLVSGKLEINCGACHSGAATYDHIEWYLQVAGQNFMWAGAACTDFATVSGAAAGMPPSYDPFMGPEDERAAKRAPSVAYQESKLDSKGRAFFDLPARPPNARCYFCHSSVQVGPGAPEPWKTDEDVHTRAGLACADCHRNGLDHQTTRNYEGEPAGKTDPQLATLTCRGCHLGAESAVAGPNTMGGRLGAPVPQHVGLPTIHLEHLACTTCHSGPYPTGTTRRVQTSMAHLIEFQGPHRGPDAMPYIVEPVYARRDYDGTIGPQRMIWPAFWCRIDADKVVPLAPDAVYEMAKDAFAADLTDDEAEAAPAEPAAATPPAETPAPEKPESAKTDAGEPGEPGDAGDAPAAPAAETPAPVAEKPKKRLTAKRIAAVLAALKAKDAKAEFGYVCQGRLYRLAADGTLAAGDHEAARPAAWPIAHNVRAAGQSLGVGGCTDCHGFGAPVAFGEVEVPSPARIGAPVVMAMYEFQGRDELQLQAWAMSYMFRPMFKVVGFTTAGLMAAVLVLYVFMGLAAMLRWAGKKAPPGPA